MKTKESRFHIHDELTAPERSLPILKGALSSGGQLSNFLGVLAGSPAVLRAYPRFRSELRHGTLPLKSQQRIALGVAEHERSEYWLATLQRTAREAGLGLDEIALAREFDSRDPREAALLRYAKALAGRDRARAPRRAVALLGHQAARARAVRPPAVGAAEGARGGGDRRARRAGRRAGPRRVQPHRQGSRPRACASRAEGLGQRVA